MKSVGDVLLAEEERFFTGREAELALMRQMFNCTSEHWRLLHFHGPDGIGKTALLRKFTHELKHQQWIHLQPSEDFQNPEQFLSALVSKIEVENLPYAQSRQNSANLDDVIHLLNHLSQAKRPFLLILDSFDHWKPIEDWFFDHFLPRLSVHLRIFTSSRNPLGNDRKEVPRRSLLVMNIALKPLYYKNVHEYILKSGIHTPQIRETIARLSNGIPLALSLFTKKVRENTEPIDSVKLAHTIHILIQTVIDGLNLSENKRQQLLAASLVWRFDINILAHMMDQPIKLTDFQQLCKLPLVTKCVDGWSLLDGVRDWIRNDFKMNAPDTYFTYKQKAFELLYQRWISTDLLDPDAKSQRFIDMLYMIENEEIKNYYFRGGHVQYKRNGLTEEQLPIIEKMWREWFPEVPPF